MRLAFTTIFLIYTWPIIGQEFYFREEPPLTDGNVRQISLLFQSSDHLLWLGTTQGLFTYDGRKYKYQPRPDLQNIKVTTIAENQENQIWVGYEDGYIHLVNLYNQDEALMTDSLKGASISKILFSPSKGNFITTYGKGTWKLVDGTLVRLKFEALASIDDIYDALLDHQGRLWLATDNGIWIYSPGPDESLRHLHRPDGLPDEIVTQLEADKNGDIWIGLYDHGLAKYKFSNDSIFTYLLPDPNSGSMTVLARGRPGEVWFSTERTLSRYSSSHHGQRIQLPADFNNRIGALLYDQSGMLWVSTGNKLSAANTRLEFWTPGLNGIQAIGIADDKIWLGCEKGLFAMDQSTGNVTSRLKKEKINVLSLYTDPTEKLWVGTFGQGLYCLDPRSEQFAHLTEKNDLSNNSILNIAGRDKTVWLATLGGITQVDWSENQFEKDILVEGFFEKFNFPEGYVYDIFASDDGRIWFGTDGKGLYTLHENQFRNFEISLPDSVSENTDLKTIYSLTQGSDHSIWISGSQGQVFQLDESGKMIKRFLNAEGNSQSLVTTGEDEILMISEGGIKVSKNWGNMMWYGESSGLKSFDPEINAVTTDKDGSVWIADQDEVWHYIPQPMDTGQHVRMHLESISPSSLYKAEDARLRPDSNFIDIRFIGLWSQDPGRIKYRYMLEGHDQNWINTSERRAVYSRLSPGTYTFIVEGTHEDDFRNAGTFRRTFLVPYPFYFRWWFVLGISLLVTWIAFKYFLSRIKRIKNLHNLEKEKTMLRLHAIQAQVNPHFLFNSFNTLAGIIEEDQPAAVDYVDQLSAFFRGVLMHRNAELIRIEEELELVRNYTFILHKRYGNNLVIEEIIHQNNGWIAPLSIQLLVENAIKHNIVSKEKPLHITLTVNKEWVSVSNPVQPKFHDSVESTGFGLSSLLARYQYLTREKIEITHTPDTFAVKIPIIQSDPNQ
ncbi:MAG TPA: two-component regulator propeller domain-containing protein [Saprospiraceae bacterium]